MKSKRVKSTFEDMRKKLWGYKHNPNMPLSKEVANELHTGAVAYYKGGGWWLISGYAADGSDINI